MRILVKFHASSFHVSDTLLKLHLLPVVTELPDVLSLVEPCALLDLLERILSLLPVSVRIEHLVDLGQSVILLKSLML